MAARMWVTSLMSDVLSDSVEPRQKFGPDFTPYSVEPLRRDEALEGQRANRPSGADFLTPCLYGVLVGAFGAVSIFLSASSVLNRSNLSTSRYAASAPANLPSSLSTPAKLFSKLATGGCQFPYDS